VHPNSKASGGPLHHARSHHEVFDAVWTSVEGWERASSQGPRGTFACCCDQKSLSSANCHLTAEWDVLMTQVDVAHGTFAKALRMVAPRADDAASARPLRQTCTTGMPEPDEQTRHRSRAPSHRLLNALRAGPSVRLNHVMGRTSGGPPRGHTGVTTVTVV
jgi:hypothetical protein